MTKYNADNSGTTSTDTGAKVRNRKPRNKAVATRAFPVVLKDILRDIAVDAPNTTLTTKAMRVKLRAKMNASHDHNATRIAKPVKVRAPRKVKEVKVEA